MIGSRRTATSREPPALAQGAAIWRRELGDWRLLVAGKGGEAALAAGAAGPPAGRARSWLHQVHSAHVVAARAGDCGEGDAVLLSAAPLVGTIATADCLPVALVGERHAAAVHAGWRGLAAGVLGAAAGALRGAGERRLAAWIGPAIGPCCYEVGDEVAAAVAAASGADSVAAGPRGRPHLDLRAAALRQLAAAGVEEMELLDHCTRCRPEWLWSYRRDGAGAGRNLLLLWRAEEAAG